MSESRVVSLRPKYTRNVYRVYLFRDGIIEPLAENFETQSAAEWDREHMAAYFPECNYYVRPALAYLN